MKPLKHPHGQPAQAWLAGSRPAHQRRLRGALLQAALAGLLVVGGPGHAEDANTAAQSTLEQPGQATAQWASLEVVEWAGQAPGVGVGGQVDAEALINTWVEAGVSPEQAVELINVMMVTQSPLVSADPDALARADALGARTQGVFEVRTPAQAEEFLRHNSLVALFQEGLVLEPELMNTSAGEGFGWEQVVGYWLDWGSYRMDEKVHAPAAGTAREMDLARQRLAQAVSRSGLASLRVPLSSWTGPDQLDQLSQRIGQLNHTLSTLTGMDGPVLGLGGRIHLMVGAPRGLGMAWPGDGQDSHVHAPWELMAHEWFHALEFAFPQAGEASGGPRQPLSQELEGRAACTPLEATWKQLAAGLAGSGAGREWAAARRQRAVHEERQGGEHGQWRGQYLRQGHEQLAARWHAHVQAHLDSGHVAWNPRSTDGVMGPTPAQVRQDAHQWQEAMAQVARHWWAGEHAAIEPRPRHVALRP